MRGFGDSDKDKRETGEREETDGQRGIEIVERQGQTETVREGERGETKTDREGERKTA